MNRPGSIAAGNVIQVAPSVTDEGRPACDRCGEAVNPNEVGVFMLVLGWVEVRRGGGTHAVADPQYFGRYRHRRCQKYPTAQGQGALL